MRTILAALALAGALSACSPAPATQATAAAPDKAAVDAIAHEAHEAYITAINTNNVDTLVADLTDDIVYYSPHEPVLVGKAAVKAWIAAYFGAYSTKWEKTTESFVVAGDWGIERYSYKSHDTPKAGGAVAEDVGKGLNIYHHDADGKWRVAQDAWNSDLPVPK